MTDVTKKQKTNEKIVNDIVHGVIKLPPYIMDIIDTAQFQRLRWIAQMGFKLFVYPTCTGTRFEHSIGTFHLASQLIRQIRNQIKEENLDLELTDIKAKCVEIAALCHDLGHGPYSHSWEHEIVPLLASDDPISHEKLSYELLFDILNKTEVITAGTTQNIKDIIGLQDEDMDLIRRIILGEYQREKDGKMKFLFEIVANKESGLDIDKFDYLCRDTIHLGWSNKNKIQDIQRIMHFYRVILNDQDQWCLALRDNEIFNVHEIFYSRHMLHRYACQHKIVKSIHCMFKDGMRRIIESKEYLKELIDDVLGEEGEESNYTSAFLKSKEFISKCCDFHIWNIMTKRTKDIVKRIIERNLYRLFSTLKITTKYKPNKTTEEAMSIHHCVGKLEEEFNKLFKRRGIRNPMKIALSVFSLGNVDIEDPLCKIPFYSRYETGKCFRYDRDSNPPPELANLIFKELIMMVFTENEIQSEDEKHILQEAVENLCKNSEEQNINQNEETRNEVFEEISKYYSFSKFYN